MSQANSARHNLSWLIRYQSDDACFSESKCKSLLMDHNSLHQRENDLLATAVKQQIPSEMLRLKQLHHSFLLPKLTRWLIRETGMDENEAKWAVDSWAMALGLIPFADGSLYGLEIQP